MAISEMILLLVIINLTVHTDTVRQLLFLVCRRLRLSFGAMVDDAVEHRNESPGDSLQRCPLQDSQHRRAMFRRHFS